MRTMKSFGRVAAALVGGALIVGLLPAETAGAAVVGSLVQRPICFDAVNPACTERASITGPTAVAVSRDGRNVYVVSSDLADTASITVFNRAQNGALTFASCRAAGGAASCGPVAGMGRAFDVAVSPNGNQVYVLQTSNDGGGIVVFDRADDGSLSQPDPGGCYTATLRPGCTQVPLLEQAVRLEVSPDSAEIYVVTAAGRLVTLTRDGTTGLLTKTDCESAVPEAGCSPVTPLAGPSDVAVSRDGKNVYTVSQDESGSALARYTRAADGSLTYRDCRGPGSSCATAVGIDGYPNAVVVSPNGKHVYVGTDGDGDGVVVVFNRSSTSSPVGRLTQPTGSARCISNSGTGATCVDGHGLGNVTGLAVAPDNLSVYATTQSPSHSIVILRPTAAGGLTEPAGAAGCISDEFGANSCTQGKALWNAYGVATSEDGNSVYVAAAGGPGGLTQYKRVSPPQTSITVGPAGQTTDRTPTFRFRSSEPGSTFACKLDKRQAHPCRSPKTYTGLKPGHHLFKVWATDKAGNRDATPAKRRFRVPASA